MKNTLQDAINCAEALSVHRDAIFNLVVREYVAAIQLHGPNSTFANDLFSFIKILKASYTGPLCDSSFIRLCEEIDKFFYGEKE